MLYFLKVIGVCLHSRQVVIEKIEQKSTADPLFKTIILDITLEWPPPRTLKTLLATLQLLTVSVRTFRYLFCHLL